MLLYKKKLFLALISTVIDGIEATCVLCPIKSFGSQICVDSSEDDAEIPRMVFYLSNTNIGIH
jgi:hypothetical protein